MNKRVKGYLRVFEPIEFGFKVTQKHAHSWLTEALGRTKTQRNANEIDKAIWLCDRLLETSQIESRVVSLPDFAHQKWDSMELLRLERAEGEESFRAVQLPLRDRMNVYARTTREIVNQAYANETEPADYQVQLSCTGYDSPSAVQLMVCDKQWHARTNYLNIGHMGCHAAVPGTALAVNLLAACQRDKNPGLPSRVSMVLMELCSLHFRVDPTLEQVVQQFLFADGAIRVDATTDFHPDAFGLLDHAEAMIPGTAPYMTWRAASPVFDMHLGQEVVAEIDKHVFDFVTVFLERNGLKVQDINRFAIHPGGPKIIHNAASALHLREEAVQHSLDILRTRGNMSSTTLPHIWNRMANDPKVEDGELICSIAFGPGLSIMANLMRKGP